MKRRHKKREEFQKERAPQDSFRPTLQTLRPSPGIFSVNRFQIKQKFQLTNDTAFPERCGTAISCPLKS